MGKYLFDHHRVFDTGDDLDGTTAFATGFDVDIEDALEALCPGHGHVAFGGCLILRLIKHFSLVVFTTLGRRHQGAVFAVGCEHAVKSCQVHSGLGHQRCQPGDEVQRLENDMGRTILVRRLELVTDIVIGCECQPFFRDRRPTDVTA